MFSRGDRVISVHDATTLGTVVYSYTIWNAPTMRSDNYRPEDGRYARYMVRWDSGMLTYAEPAHHLRKFDGPWRQCATCHVPVKPSADNNNLWADASGTFVGPDRGDVPFVQGKINYWHGHDPYAQVIRQNSLRRTQSEQGRSCEACGRHTHDHEWIALDDNGFAAYCSYKSERN